MKKLFRHGVIAALVLAAGALYAANQDETVILRENFDQGFQTGPLPAKQGKLADGSYCIDQGTPLFNWSIISEEAASKPYAFKVLRDGGNGYFGMIPEKTIPAGVNFSVELKAFTFPGNGVVVFFMGQQDLMGGALIYSEQVPKAYNTAQGWEESGKEFPTFPDKQWVTVRYDFDCSEEFYTTTVTYPDGKVVKGDVRHPFLNGGPLKEVRLINILPEKSFSYIDDVVISYSNKVDVNDRTDFALAATSVNKDLEALVRSGRTLELTGEPLTLEFSPAIKFNALLLTAASGAVLPEKVTLRARDNSGRWTQLAENAAVDPTTGYLQFPTLENADRLELQFDGTGKSALAGLKVLAPAGTPQGKLDKLLAEKIDAEYKLPVYDLQYPGCDKGELTIDNKSGKPMKLELRFHERRSDTPAGSRIESIPAGFSAIAIDLNGMPNGEYLTYITDVTEDSDSKGGQMLRMLRLWTSPEVSVAPRTDVTGNRIFFPDGFYLAKMDNVDFTTAQARPVKVYGGTPGVDDPWVHHALDIGLTQDGKLGIHFYTTNRVWEDVSRKYYTMVADVNDLSKWTKVDGSLQLDVAGSNALFYRHPAAARPDWQPKKGPDGKIKYRFYDPETDGPVKLNQVMLKYINYASKGMAGYEEIDWGILTPTTTTIWPIWYKAPGEAIILSKKPLVSGFPGGGEPEPIDSGSDLHFGQYLSDDGKELFYGFGRHLIRNNPEIAEYDNLFDRARIVGLWRTRDGLNWDFNYVAPPDNSKPMADQSYGGNYFPVPRANGLRMALLSRYSAYYQQISWEFIYSWDGFRWTRFQNKPQFAENGKFGTWNHGGGNVEMAKTITHNGKNYSLMTWVNDHYHFQSEIVHGSVNTVDHMTADYMRNRMEPRKLAKWPYFQKYFGGSWEKLAEHTRNATSAVGLLEYRQDGFFYLTAKGDDIAVFETVPLTSKNSKMTANIEVEADGFVKFTILDENGAVFAEKTIDGAFDAIESIIADALPEGKFTVRAELKNARLYTLGF